jgi:hypothetical protein
MGLSCDFHLRNIRDLRKGVAEDGQPGSPYLNAVRNAFLVGEAALYVPVNLNGVLRPNHRGQQKVRNENLHLGLR